jgi:hypothetical protein
MAPKKMRVKENPGQKQPHNPEKKHPLTTFLKVTPMLAPFSVTVTFY